MLPYADLNVSVLRWYLPSATAVLSISPYVALYHFSPDTQTWEKADIEGPMFVCALAPTEFGEELYAVAIMNRRSLENFVLSLTSTNEMDFQDGFIILNDEIQNAQGEHGMKVYGLWVHTADMQAGDVGLAAQKQGEPDVKEINYQIMLECARRAEASRGVPPQDQGTADDLYDDVPVMPVEEELVPQSEAMGRQLSLRELFSRQREEDSGFSIHDHHSRKDARLSTTQPQQAQFATNSQHNQGFAMQNNEFDQTQVLAPTAVHTYSTTAAVHNSAVQLPAPHRPVQQTQLQAQSQQLLSLFQPQQQTQQKQLDQQPAQPLAQQSSVSQSSTPFFQSNPDTDFFRGPPRHTPQQQPAMPHLPIHDPMPAHSGMAGAMAGFGQGLSVDQLFSSARNMP